MSFANKFCRITHLFLEFIIMEGYTRFITGSSHLKK